MFGHPGECRVIVNILNEPLRTQCAPPQRTERATVHGSEILVSPLCSFSSRVSVLFWCPGMCGRPCRARRCIFEFCTALLLLYAPVSLECCRARSQLSNAHIITFQLVRSGENEPPDCLCAIRRSAPSQRGAFWWNFRLILGLLNRPLEPHWHSLNRKICDF